MERFSQWISGFPGMLWRIEQSRSRMTVFNDWVHPLLGQDTARLIKDSQFRKKVVRREDLPLLAEYRDVVAAKQPAAVNFYLKDEPDTPLLLQGWPAPNEPDIFCGFLKYSYLPIPYANGSVPGSCQMALSRAGYPVLVVDTHSRSLLVCNDAARKRFLPLENSDSLPFFDAIAPGETGDHLIAAARKALEDEIWAGTLVFLNADGQPFHAKVRLSPCSPEHTDGIVRIALLASPELEHAEHAVSVLDTADVALNADELLKKGLEKLFESSRVPLDGLMFSDIQSLKGRVDVYGVGHCFEQMKWGDSHDYEGTIAQDIERFNLTSLSVEDTLDSIKSIDWVMFIPHGVRSYFALPFFSAQGLHAVLIFASEQPKAFPQDAAIQFAPLMEPFEKLIAAWRRQHA